MNVGYVFDEGFAAPAAVSIYSLMYNNRHLKEICFYILDDGIAEESKKRLCWMVSQFHRNIRFIDVQIVKKKLSETTRFNWNGSYSTYIRLMLNTLIPDSVDRIVMIDGDTIIHGRLDYFDKLELDKNEICAMALEAMPRVYHKYSGLGNHELFNGGLIVVDLKRWKMINAEDQIINYLSNVREKNMLTDEDVLSTVFMNRIKRIPPEYNYLTQYYLYASKPYIKLFGWEKLARAGVFYTLEEMKNARSKTVMYHCIDTFTNRPWYSNNIHPYKLLYEKYLSYTPWRDIAKPVRKMRLNTKIEYGMRRFLPKKLSRLMYAVAVIIYYGSGAKAYYRFGKAHERKKNG